MAHTLTLFCGNEDQDTIVARTGSQAPVKSQTRTHFSDWSWYWNPNGVGGSQYINVPRFFNSDGSYVGWGAEEYNFVMAALNFAAWPGSSQYLYLWKWIDGSSNPRAWLRVNSSGGLERSLDGGAWTSVCSLDLDKWYTFSMRWLRNTTNGWKLIVRQGNTEIANVQANASDYPIQALYFGDVGTTSYGSCYLDNVVVERATTAGNVDDPFDLVGPYYAERVMIPNAAGTDNSGPWTGSYADVDEIPNDGDTTVRTTPWGGEAYFTQHLSEAPTPTGWNISACKGVIGLTVCQGTDSSSYRKVRLRRGSTVSETFTERVTPPGYEGQGTLWLTDPTDSGAWTADRLSTVELGVHRTSGGQYVHCTEVLLFALLVFSPTGAGGISWLG